MFSQYFSSQYSLLQDVDFIIRILVSGLCGFVLGLERSRRFKEAGVRTHMIVCVAAALVMIVSKYGFMDEPFSGTRGADPARLAAQVVSGVSFLGAGMIFKNGGSVTGLTTAAGIWATAAIGLAIGSGMVLMGVLVTVFISLIQLLMHIVPVAADAYRSCNIDFLVEKSPDFQKIFEKILAEYGATIVECRITRQGDLQHYNVTVRSRKLIKADDLNKKLESCGLIREIDVLSV